MLYLATPSSRAAISAMEAGLLGCMTTPAQGNRIPAGAYWAADNGKFGKGWPGERKWFEWLCQQADTLDRDRCIFAVAPDVPFDAVGTFRESRPWLAKIRELGLPAAYAAQDGCEVDDLLPWDEFDVLFLGGTTEWKIGPVARQLCAEAKARGKQVHMGRVNSRRRLGIAEFYGCDSADGTYLVFGPDQNLPKLLNWLSDLESQPSITSA